MITPSPRGGFTLIEILACVLLFALGILAIVGVVLMGQRSAAAAQGDATAWATAITVLKDPLPMGSTWDEAAGGLTRWTWSKTGNTWTADDGSSTPAWSYTTWPLDLPSDVLVADMGAPVPGDPAVFPSGGSPAVGCANGWLNGYYVERREQSRASDRLGAGMRQVEVRVDVYWAEIGSDGYPLATVFDRVVRVGAP